MLPAVRRWATSMGTGGKRLVDARQGRLKVGFITRRRHTEGRRTALGRLPSMPLSRFLFRSFLCLALAAASQAHAQPLASLLQAPTGQDTTASTAEPASTSTTTRTDATTLNQSLDTVIRTLENRDQRQALIGQLKALREGIQQQGAQQQGIQQQASPPAKTENPTENSAGVLGVLADSFRELDQAASSGQGSWGIWAQNGQDALADIDRLLAANGDLHRFRHLLETLAGLLIWLVMLLFLVFLGRWLFRYRGWPLVLPDEPHPRQLVAHVLRQVLPWLLTFLALLFTLDWLEAPAAARTLVLVVAYVTLCGRVLASVVEAVVSLFTRGHRQVAVAIIRRRGSRPLFVIGALVAFGDAVISERLVAMLGEALAAWLSVCAGVLAGLISGWLILRLRRPVSHLLCNRPWSRRHRERALSSLIRPLGRLWYIPALFFIGTPLVSILVTGGGDNRPLPRAIVCAVLLVLTLVVTGLLRRQAEKVPNRRRRREYRLRLARVGYTLLHCLCWLVFVELSLRVWGLSLLSLGDHSRVGALISGAVLVLGLTFLLAWLLWVLADTAIERALGGSRHASDRANNRAQTITPMIRNVVFFTILLIAGIVALSNLGVNVTPLLAGAGVIGLAIGFGAQTLVQDLITGLFILVEDSLAVGDFVEIGGFMGTVEGLNLRTVRLRDLDGVLHLITFSHIPSIHNMSRHFGIALMKIRIPYDLPIDEAIRLMKETSEELRQDPVMRYQVWSPLEMQGIHSFEDGCAILRMRLRTAPEYQWDVSRAFNLLLKRRMEAQFVKLGAPRLSVSMEAQGGRHYDGKGKEQEGAEGEASQAEDAGPAVESRGSSPDPG